MWITNWLAAAGLITMLFEVAAVSTGELVNWSVMVSAVSSARLVNVAMPPETVTVVVPCSGPEPSGSEAAVTWVAVVAGLQVAELVFDVDHRLRAEGHARRRRGEGWVLITNWLAAAGLITMLLEVAAVRTGELVN